MTQITEAIYANGVLRPIGQLELRDNERVRLIIEPVESSANGDRAAAMVRLRAGVKQMNFRHGGPYPSRDELHYRI